MRTAFDDVWARVERLSGQAFATKTGKLFTFTMTSGGVSMNTTHRVIPRWEFQRALDRMPVSGPGELQDLQGPPYIFAILTIREFAPLGLDMGRPDVVAMPSVLTQRSPWIDGRSASRFLPVVPGQTRYSGVDADMVAMCVGTPAPESEVWT